MSLAPGTASRGVFLRTLEKTRPLLGSAQVRNAWDRPSALERMTVGSLAAHLGRSLFNVERYLDATSEVPDGEPESPAAYYATILPTFDLDAPINADVRTRSDSDATAGWERLIERFDAAVGSLRDRLESEPPTRKVTVFGGLTMHLDDYLVTRTIECIVHADDLAVSVELPTPAFDQDAVDLVIATMIGIARLRHGDLAVVRALSRRERDELDALRVL